MSESAVGLLVTATRQNAGAAAIARATGGVMPRPGVADGGVNVPAATTVAEVTVAFGSCNDDRLSHDAGAPAIGCCAGASRARTTQIPACEARFICIHVLAIT